MIEEELWINHKKQKQRIFQPRYRRDCYGELVQIDGSEHYWFEERGPQCTLLVFIDDATGRLQELRFVRTETTFDYFYSTKRYLERYGKPIAFYSDKHSIFRVNKSGATHGTGMTQFGRALHELNIDIICANTAQAKGRVERANRTLQDRLVKELRLRGISSIDQGNLYLDEFREAFNKRFARVPVNETDVHRELTEFDNMDVIFSWQEERTVTNSLTIQYDRVVYLLEPNPLTTQLSRKKVKIYDYPDGTIEICYQGIPLPYSIFDQVRQVKQADIVSNKRLGAVLELAKQKQQSDPVTRSQKAPKRSGQRQILRERQINAAVLNES
jgi:hypothetical protein